MAECLDVLMDTQKNPITLLQELSQMWSVDFPIYRECGGNYSEFGTQVTFTPCTETGHPVDTVVREGLGRTKKASKTEAARNMLQVLAKEQPHMLRRPQTPKVSICYSLP